jgi:hypothetical protein
MDNAGARSCRWRCRRCHLAGQRVPDSSGVRLRELTENVYRLLTNDEPSNKPE